MNPKAPPLADGDWLTTSPIGKAHLAGRVTIITFFSVDNEASWVRLRQLEDLSADLGDTLAIIAVHSPRLDSERDLDLVERALARSPLPFPVVHDRDLASWARFDPGGWPSTVVIDHHGRLLGMSQGIDDLDVLFEAVHLAEQLARADRPTPSETTLRPLPVPEPPAVDESQILQWPSGLCRLSDGRIALADSGNDRVVLIELDPELRSARIGSSAGVRRPDQLTELPDGDLAVSQPDAGRVVRLGTEGETETLIDGMTRPRGLAIDLDGSLVITDGARDQIFRFRPDRDEAPTLIAGSGSFGSNDDQAGLASLAQPVAVLLTENGLAFSDRASSSLRLLTNAGQVLTAVGGSHRAGLVDGAAASASLLSPRGLAQLPNGTIAICDAGNHRIRMLRDRELTTLGVVGLCGTESAVAIGDDHLLVADTGNHRLVVIDLRSDEVWELELDDPAPRSFRRADDTRMEHPAGSRSLINPPTPGSGPWRVAIKADPAELLSEPIRSEIDESGEPIAIEFGEPGEGRLAIHAAGPDPATARVQVRHLRLV